MTLPKHLPPSAHDAEQSVVRGKDSPTEVTPDLEPRCTFFGSVGSGQSRDDVLSDYSRFQDESAYLGMFGSVGWSGYGTTEASSAFFSDSPTAARSEWDETRCSGWDDETETAMESNVGRRLFLKHGRRNLQYQDDVRSDQSDASFAVGGVIREVAKVVALYTNNDDDDDLDFYEQQTTDDSWITDWRTSPSSAGFASSAEGNPRYKCRGSNALKIEERGAATNGGEKVIGIFGTSWLMNPVLDEVKEDHPHYVVSDEETQRDDQVDLPVSIQETSPRRESTLGNRRGQGVEQEKCGAANTTPLNAIPRHPTLHHEVGAKPSELIVDISKKEEQIPPERQWTWKDSRDRTTKGSSGVTRTLHQTKNSQRVPSSPVSLKPILKSHEETDATPQHPALGHTVGAKHTDLTVDISNKKERSKLGLAPERQWTWKDTHDRDVKGLSGGKKTLPQTEITQRVLSTPVPAKRILKSHEEIDVRSGLPFGMDVMDDEFESETRSYRLNLEAMSSAYRRELSTEKATLSPKRFFTTGRAIPTPNPTGNPVFERRGLRKLIWKVIRGRREKGVAANLDAKETSQSCDFCGLLLCFHTE